MPREPQEQRHRLTVTWADNTTTDYDFDGEPLVRRDETYIQYKEQQQGKVVDLVTSQVRSMELRPLPQGGG